MGPKRAANDAKGLRLRAPVLQGTDPKPHPPWDSDRSEEAEETENENGEDEAAVIAESEAEESEAGSDEVGFTDDEGDQ